MFVTDGLQNPQNAKEFGGHDLVRTIHRYSRFLALLGEKWGCVLYMGAYSTWGKTVALAHSVSRTLRSTGANLLYVPKSNIVKGDRAFMIAGPKVWNSLPSNIRAITNLVDFKKKLKTFFYRKAFM